MEGKTQTDLIDLSSIDKVPVSIFSGELDVTCSNWEATNTKKTIGERVRHFRTVRAVDHGLVWDGGKGVTDELLNEIKESLVNPEHTINHFDQFLY